MKLSVNGSDKQFGEYPDVSLEQWHERNGFSRSINSLLDGRRNQIVKLLSNYLVSNQTMDKQTPDIDFFQEGPQLGNQFADDVVLRSFLTWKLPKSILSGNRTWPDSTRRAGKRRYFKFSARR